MQNSVRCVATQEHRFCKECHPKQLPADKQCAAHRAPAGCLWQLDGEAFRGAIARSKQDLKGLVKTLRGVGQLQALSVSQLEVLAEAMQPVSMRLGSSLPEVV